MPDFPVYQIQVNDLDKTGVSLVSFVKAPAMEVTAVKLAAEQQQFKLGVNPLKRTLTSAVIVPDKLVYRKMDSQEFYITFSTEVIERIRDKFFQSTGNLHISNIDHTEQQVQATLVESWVITDAKQDKAQALGFDLPVGTWMATYKVEDERFWKSHVETNKVTGFSLEGIFDLAPVSLAAYSYGCVMLDFASFPAFEQVQQAIDPSHVDAEAGGLESEPHVTILYGLHPEVTLDQVQVIVDNQGVELTVELTGLSLFESEKYDVLKFTVEGCQPLHDFNAALKSLPHTSKFPQYVPHLTVGYLRKGTGQQYVQKFAKPVVLSSGQVAYSTPAGDRNLFQLHSLDSLLDSLLSDLHR